MSYHPGPGTRCSRRLNCRASNSHVVALDQVLSASEHAFAIQWPDRSAGTAVLFNLFHGTKLVLKGFLAVKGLFGQARDPARGPC